MHACYLSRWQGSIHTVGTLWQPRCRCSSATAWVIRGLPRALPQTNLPSYGRADSPCSAQCQSPSTTRVCTCMVHRHANVLAWILQWAEELWHAGNELLTFMVPCLSASFSHITLNSFKVLDWMISPSRTFHSGMENIILFPCFPSFTLLVQGSLNKASYVDVHYKEG